MDSARIARVAWLTSGRLASIVLFFFAMLSLSLSGCHTHEAHAEGGEGHGTQKVVVTSPKEMDVAINDRYVCQIHSQRHTKVRALESGYLEPIPVKEGQAVKEGQVLFSVIPVLYKAKLDAELAEVQLAQRELSNTNQLLKDKVVSPNEQVLYMAKLARAEAKAKLAEAELNFTKVRAPYDGIIDRLYEMQGSLVKEGDELTTLSDNSVMWVYYNVPEARYIEDVAKQKKDDATVELILANGKRFAHQGKFATIEGKFNNETGNIPYRADFPNPEGMLRHGMTGNVQIRRTLKNAIVIPQRATFDILAKRYVYVIDKDNKVRQREIDVENELDDIFVIRKGIDVNDKIVYEGVRQLRDGDHVEFEYRRPDDILGHQTVHAE